MKKTAITLIIFISLAAGWYFLVQKDNSSQQRSIDQIVAQTDKEVANFAPEVRESIQKKLKTRSVPEVDAADYEKTSAITLSFATPWGEPTSVEGNETLKEITYSNDKSIMVSRVPDSQTPQSLLQDVDNRLPATSTPSLELFNQALGENFTSFEFMKYLLSSTPKEVSSANTAQEAKTRHRAITLRQSVFPAGTPYVFEAKSVKGFQVGNPENKASIWFMVTDKESGEYIYDINVRGGPTESNLDLLLGSLQITEQ